MNKVQKSIAKITGLEEEIKVNQTLVEQQERLARESMSTVAELERLRDEVMYLSVGEVPWQKDKILQTARNTQTIRRLRVMRQENPLAKQAMKLVLRFTLGKGVSYIVDDHRAADIWDEFWNDPVNEATLTSRKSLQDRFDEKLTDGEKFYAFATSPGIAPYVRVSCLPMEEVVEIIYHPQNRYVPLFYKRQFIPRKYDFSANNGEGGWVDDKDQAQDGKNFKTLFYRDYRISDDLLEDISEVINIPQEKMAPEVVMHSLINGTWTNSGYRGISELYSSRDWFKVFKEFMEDRASINAMANAISMIRKVKAGPTGVAKVTGTLGGSPVGLDASMSPEDRRLTRPLAGSILDINADASDLATIRADTGAVDAKEDGRSILMAAGAGVGTNIHYFGEGGDANLATASAMELPMVKGYEDWQEGLKDDLNEIYWFTVMTALDLDQRDGIPDRMRKIAWSFPPIVTPDVTKFTTAWAQLAQQIGPGNLKIKEVAIKGALNTMHVENVDGMMDGIMAEEARLQAIKDEQRELQNAAMAAKPGADGSPSPAKKKDDGEGQKVGDGGYTPALDPDATRTAAGKPPRNVATGPRAAKGSK